jgi:hypothetical protein
LIGKEDGEKVESWSCTVELMDVIAKETFYG